MASLPLEIIYNILTFDKRFVVRDGKLITINKIHKNDMRIDKLTKKPLIYQFTYDNNLNTYPSNHGIVCLSYKNSIKYSIHVLHFIEPTDSSKEILHCFMKYKFTKTDININIQEITADSILLYQCNYMYMP
jgi:hypothetical protein